MNIIMECEWLVWVGSFPVNEFLLPRDEAIELALQYIKDDYTDVAIENTNTNKVLYLNDLRKFVS